MKWSDRAGMEQVGSRSQTIGALLQREEQDLSWPFHTVEGHTEQKLWQRFTHIHEWQGKSSAGKSQLSAIIMALSVSG